MIRFLFLCFAFLAVFWLSMIMVKRIHGVRLGVLKHVLFLFLFSIGMELSSILLLFFLVLLVCLTYCMYDDNSIYFHTIPILISIYIYSIKKHPAKTSPQDTKPASTTTHTSPEHPPYSHLPRQAPNPPSHQPPPRCAPRKPRIQTTSSWE